MIPRRVLYSRVRRFTISLPVVVHRRVQIDAESMFKAFRRHRLCKPHALASSSCLIIFLCHPFPPSIPSLPSAFHLAHQRGRTALHRLTCERASGQRVFAIAFEAVALCVVEVSLHICRVRGCGVDRAGLDEIMADLDQRGTLIFMPISRSPFHAWFSIS